MGEINGIKHQLYTPDHMEGVVACSVCGGFANGSLLSFCPGYKLNPEALEAIYRGDVVIDFLYAIHRLVATRRDYDGKGW